MCVDKLLAGSLSGEGDETSNIVDRAVRNFVVCDIYWA
jgi:hypothetical protein